MAKPKIEIAFFMLSRFIGEIFMVAEHGAADSPGDSKSPGE
jgi:hypothetical protein